MDTEPFREEYFEAPDGTPYVSKKLPRARPGFVPCIRGYLGPPHYSYDGSIVRLSRNSYLTATAFGPHEIVIQGKVCKYWDQNNKRPRPDPEVGSQYPYYLGLSEEGDVYVCTRQDIVNNKDAATGETVTFTRTRAWDGEEWFVGTKDERVLCHRGVQVRMFGSSMSEGLGPVHVDLFRGTNTSGEVCTGATCVVRVLGRSIYPDISSHVHVFGPNAVATEGTGLYSATNWLPGLGAITTRDAHVLLVLLALFRTRSPLPEWIRDNLFVRICLLGHARMAQ